MFRELRHSLLSSFERARRSAAAPSSIKSTAALAAERAVRATRSGVVKRFAGIVLLALALASPFLARAQKPATPTAELPAGPMQAKVTTACTECHEARIILQQRLSKAAWTKEVDKMMKWGALVDAADRDVMIDYLSTNFSPDKPAYEPPRTAAGKSAKKK
jgi:hypothetical protein